MILTLLSRHLQLEDAEFAAQSALKNKKKLEEDVADLQSQLDILSKSKKEVTQTSPANLKWFYQEHPFEKSINKILSRVVLLQKGYFGAKKWKNRTMHKTNSSDFIDGRAPGILNGCQDEKTVALLLKMLMKTPAVWSTLDNKRKTRLGLRHMSWMSSAT